MSNAANIQRYEILVWTGKRMRGSKVHIGVDGPNGKMLCGYWGSERTTFTATNDTATCAHCVTAQLTKRHASMQQRFALLTALTKFEEFVDGQPAQFSAIENEIMQACLRIVAGYEDTEAPQ